MRVPDVVRECVVFLQYKDRDGRLKLAGTGFFVGISWEQRTDRNFVYLITAKHVILGARHYSSDGQILIRVNTKGHGFALETVAADRWLLHPSDESADVAVFPWPYSFTNLQCKFVEFEVFLTAQGIKDEGVGLADEIFLTGLFRNHVGETRNLPIVRTGTIAAMPEEPVNTRLGKMDAYLIEARSINGLSGSPVFVYSQRARPTAQGNARVLHLLGLVHGHFDMPEETHERASQAMAPTERLNVGVAIVVPALKILEVLFQPSLQALRQAEEAALTPRNEG